MKLIRCLRNKNHYYDGDKYTECPHCIGEAGGGKATPLTETVSARNVSLVFPSKQGISQTGSMRQQSERGCIGKTEALITRGNREEPAEGSRTVQQPPVEPAEPQSPHAPDNSPVVRSLQEAVDTVKRPAITDESKTMAFYDVADEEPVVGWLVCIKGEYFGESFKLKTGRNTVGRSLKMDVPLAKEPSVSRDRHAIITYEPKKRKFYIQSGEVGGLTYVNEDLLLVPAELQNYDRVQLGKSEFVFCALCGQQFTWDDYV